MFSYGRDILICYGCLDVCMNAAFRRAWQPFNQAEPTLCFASAIAHIGSIPAPPKTAALMFPSDRNEALRMHAIADARLHNSSNQ